MKFVQVMHEGNHDHGRPPPIHPTSSGLQKVQKLIADNPTIKPKALSVGSKHRKPAYELDPMFINDARLRKTRKAVIKQLQMNDPATIMDYEKETGVQFVSKSSCKGEEGCIIMQTPTMKKQLRFSSTACQTDAIEGYVLDNNHGNLALVTTSSYCDIRGKWYPTQFGIMYGRTHLHYKFYFVALLESMGFIDFNDFEQNYLGMICDFSEASRMGFQLAVSEVFHVGTNQFKMEALYAFCQVHFKRSMDRVKRNYEVVPEVTGDNFSNQVRSLLDPGLLYEKFIEQVDTILQLWPKAKSWLNWHLVPSRGSLIFPSLAEKQFPQANPNTNAQESFGNVLQLSGEKHLNVLETYEHCLRHANKNDKEYTLLFLGYNVQWRHPSIKSNTKKRKRSLNDGRAPPPDSKLNAPVGISGDYTLAELSQKKRQQ
jgi:hypothetical protein